MSNYWVQFTFNSLAAWYMTYLIFSTVFLGAVALLTRFHRPESGSEVLLWRLAVVAAPVLAGARIAIEHTDRSVVAGSALATVAGTVGWVLMGITLAGTVVTAWLVLRLAGAARRERERLAARRPVRDPRTLAALNSLAQDFERPLPRLTECDDLLAPVAIGRREICLPTGMLGLPDEALRAVLAHEMSHLRESDSYWATLVQMIDRVGFLQPLQRLASRRIREAAEFRADEYAVRRTGDPGHLVTALAYFARSGGNGVAVSGFGPGSLLLRRTERILFRHTAEQRTRGIVVVGAIVAIALLAWFSPAVVPACDCLWRGL